MTRQSKLWRAGFRIPYPSCLIARASGQSAAGCRTELSGQYRFAMARYSMGHSRNCLDFEDSLRFGAERYRRLERVLNTMAAQQLEKVGRILVNNNVCLRDVYSKPVGEKLFPVLNFFDPSARAPVCENGREQTLASSVFNNSDRFFSDASARGTSMTSAICCPSLSRNRALNEPAGPATTAETSCCICVFSRFSRFWRLDGGGRTVAMARMKELSLDYWYPDQCDESSRQNNGGGADWQKIWEPLEKKLGGENVGSRQNLVSPSPAPDQFIRTLGMPK